MAIASTAASGGRRTAANMSWRSNIPTVRIWRWPGWNATQRATCPPIWPWAWQRRNSGPMPPQPRRTCRTSTISFYNGAATARPCCSTTPSRTSSRRRMTGISGTTATPATSAPYWSCSHSAAGCRAPGRMRTSQMHKVKLLKLESLGLKVCYARANGKEYEKPHIDAFSRALAMLDSAPSTCLFVGDNPRTDILGANNAGLTSVHLQRGYGALIPCTNASRTITHLTQIKDYW